jgi:FeS assembly SUF system protein
MTTSVWSGGMKGRPANAQSETGAAEASRGLEPMESAEKTPQPARSLSTIEQTVIQNQAIEAIRLCYDPEIPVNIYDLGLIYDVAAGVDGVVTVTMTLTSPHCPAAQSLPRDVEMRVGKVQGVTGVRVNVVWSPPWNPSMMSEAAKLELGF